MSNKVHGSELMAEAEKIVKPQYPTAVQVENVGTSSRGSATSAEDVDQWRFVFTDIDSTEIVTLSYSKGKFGKPEREVRAWITTQIKELPRDMPLSQAIASIRSAGHKEPFQSVTLRAPFSDEERPTYVFQMGKKAVYLDALGGEVTRVVEET